MSKMYDARWLPDWLREWQLLILLLVMVKAAFLMWDPGLRLFLGDSAIYLRAAMTEWRPLDRSFSYPWLVSLAVWTRSSLVLVLIQTAMGLASCVIAYWLLRKKAGMNFPVSLFAVLLLAAEPTQLFYERMLLAETAGMLGLMIFVVMVTSHVSTGRWYWAVSSVMVGLGVVSLRMSLLPTVIGLNVLSPILHHVAKRHDGSADGRWWIQAKRWLLSWVIVFGAHLAYQYAYGFVMECAPGYLCSEVQMRLGLVAPLVKRDHLLQVELSPEILDRVAHPLTDPHSREAQIWSSGGLWAQIKNDVGEDQARVSGGRVAWLAVCSDPVGFIGLGINNVLGYLGGAEAEVRFSDDSGNRRPDARLMSVLGDALGVEELPHANAGVGSWFRIARWWLPFAFFANVPVALIVMRREFRRSDPSSSIIVLSTTAIILVLAHTLFAHIASFRYLHPIPVLFVLCAVVLADVKRWRG